MSILSLEGVTRQYRAEPVFEGLSLSLADGERVGIIGANGCGKSTLLRLMAGVETPDEGRVIVSDGVRRVLLLQNPVMDVQRDVLGAIFEASTDATRLVADYEAACQDATDDAVSLARIAELSARLEASGAWDLETRARTVLSHLGIHRVTQQVSELSGGQRKRVALAHALLNPADILLLDEPTNQLDVAAIAWLERFLSRWSGTLVLVTHDRYFLDRVGTRMIELDRGKLRSFDGNYASYLEQKAVLQEREAATAEKRSNLMRQELAWLRRGARARATKQKAHVERAEALLAERPDMAAGTLDMSLSGRRLGRRAVELSKVTKGFGDRSLIRNFSYEFQRGDRIGIVGPNGCGKTTLLELVARRGEPDRGTVEHGPTVALGYYDQESRQLKDEQRVIDYIQDVARVMELSDGTVVTASQLLERFLFAGAIQYAPIGRLSGGERRRLYLLRVLMGNPNVLLLDEPTNDLDIPTLMRLEEYLDSFGGVLIAVSHDRWFLDRTVDTILAFGEPGQVEVYPGGASEWLDTHATDMLTMPEAPKTPVKTAAPVVAKARRMSFKERQELAQVERDIPRAEARIHEIEASLATDSSDYEGTLSRYRELETLKANVDAWTDRWAELSELPADI